MEMRALDNPSESQYAFSEELPMNHREQHENYNEHRLQYLELRDKVFELYGYKCAMGIRNE